MHRYNEIQQPQEDGYDIALGIARDLLAMLLCAGTPLFLLFLARGL